MPNNASTVTVAERFAEIANRAPAAPAIVSEDQLLSYRDLHDQVARLAALLERRGVGVGDPVALLLERSVDFVTAWLAVIWAGAVAVPLDPADPPTHNAEIARRCGVKLTVTHARYAGHAADTDDATLLLDTERMLLASLPPTGPVTRLRPTSPAAVTCTSGSTGLPKTVLVPHEGIIAGADWVADALDLGPGDGHILKTAVNFTSVLRQVAWPLLTGGWTYVLPADAGGDLRVLSRVLDSYEITICSFFPSTLNAMLNAGLSAGSALRHLMFGGEPLPGELVRRAAAATGAQSHNVYGMTECNLALWLPCPQRPTFELAPLGDPVGGLTVRIDRSGTEAGDAVGGDAAGELVVSGPHVALEYLGEPELSAQRFAVTDEGTRSFATRDLVSETDGLRYVGRVDDRVKVRGYSIELGAVEQAVRRHPAVADCVVAVQSLSVSDQRLVAFLIGHGEVDPGEVRDHLRTELPPYMVPGVVRVVANFPRKSNGKIDRRALVEQAHPPEERREAAAERRLDDAMALFALVLEAPVERIDPDGDFFDLGGHSLLLLRLGAELTERHGVEIELDELAERPTARRLAEFLAERTAVATEDRS